MESGREKERDQEERRNWSGREKGRSGRERRIKE
jgi:hypothetical protein